MRLLFSILSLFSFLTLFPVQVLAQVTSSGISVSIPADEEIEEGSLVCSGREGYILCDDDYDPRLFGVSSDSPAASIEDEELTVFWRIISSGIASVRVTNENGAITAGNLLTSSNTPGVAQKATRNGYVVGTALEDFDAESGSITVSLNIHPTAAFTDVRSNLLDALREGLAAPVLTPINALRYIVAGVIIISSFIMGFMYFGRVAKTGVEAIGRNPLARKTIEFTVLLHILITIIIVLVGFGISYLILVI